MLLALLDIHFFLSRGGGVRGMFWYRGETRASRFLCKSYNKFVVNCLACVCPICWRLIFFIYVCWGQACQAYVTVGWILLCSTHHYREDFGCFLAPNYTYLYHVFRRLFRCSKYLYYTIKTGAFSTNSFAERCVSFRWDICVPWAVILQYL